MRPPNLERYQDGQSAVQKKGPLRVRIRGFEQKGSDLNLSSNHIVELVHRVIDIEILITNDGDLAGAAK